MRSDVSFVLHRQEFNERAGKLDDVIPRAPFRRVTVARADLKAKPAVQRHGRVEVIDRMDDMVEAARHHDPVVGFTGWRKTRWDAGTRF
jgi:hypothetical protein